VLDTGLRVAELAKLTKDNLDWQNHRLMIYGKGGPGRMENYQNAGLFRFPQDCKPFLKGIWDYMTT